MPVSLKYAVVERERRFLVSHLPDGVVDVWEVVDRYVTGTRLRLREVTTSEGAVVRKLGHKVRLGDGPEAIACTSLYLDDVEWGLLAALPADILRKRRHVVERDGVRLVVDEHEDGALVAEIDDADLPLIDPPSWLPVLREVTLDEAWTGARLVAPGPTGGVRACPTVSG